MNYKTIVLQLIEDRPILHKQLRQSRRILATVEQYAQALKACQESWLAKLTQAQPNGSHILLTSQSLELAIQELKDSLPAEFAETNEPETLTLDAAMTFVLRHMPSA